MKTNNTRSSQNSYLLKKAISIVIFVAIFYVLPLAGKTELLADWKVILLASICSLLFATQPRVSIAESKNKKATDRNTMLLILFVSGAGQIISLLEWAYVPKEQISICAIRAPLF